jgi:hypothetical protein
MLLMGWLAISLLRLEPALSAALVHQELERPLQDAHHVTIILCITVKSLGPTHATTLCTHTFPLNIDFFDTARKPAKRERIGNLNARHVPYICRVRSCLSPCQPACVIIHSLHFIDLGGHSGHKTLHNQINVHLAS